MKCANGNCLTRRECTEFQKDSQKPDGLRKWCKSCVKEHNTRYRIIHADEIRAKEKARPKTEERILSHRKANKKYFATDKGVANKSRAGYVYRNKYTERIIAKNMVNNAVHRNKRNRNPCQICGATENIHGHHPDYSKPSEVIWLCVKHHNMIHQEMRRTKKEQTCKHVF